MLDGRVLGASQVEYKPFGKLPLKREPGLCGGLLQREAVLPKSVAKLSVNAMIGL